MSSAQQNIGSTAVAHNDVSRELTGATGPLNVGDPVFRDEVVRTGTESTAKVIFLDSTNLAVGPISRVLLDRFVYDETKTAQSMAIKLTKGVFRFTTGVLDKNAYSVTTPTAAIGVRGTVLDISVGGDRTKVTLVEGRALVCPVKKGTAFEQQARDCAKGHSAHCDCVELNNAGQTAQVRRAGGATQAAFTPSPVQFAALCSGDAALCSGASYASVGGGGGAGGVNGSTLADVGGGGASLCGR